MSLSIPEIKHLDRPTDGQRDGQQSDLTRVTFLIKYGTQKNRKKI